MDHHQEAASQQPFQEQRPGTVSRHADAAGNYAATERAMNAEDNLQARDQQDSHDVIHLVSVSPPPDAQANDSNVSDVEVKHLKSDQGSVGQDCAYTDQDLVNVVDSLPDEILVLIFSNIKEGITLLDSVPLVCRRWSRLSRDQGSWSGVDLEIRHGLWVHKEEKLKESHRKLLHDELLKTARVLLHAPALRNLTMSWLTAGIRPQQRTILSAARRSQAKLRELEMWDCSDMPNEAREVFYQLLWRSRDCIRSFTFEVPLEPLRSRETSDDDSSDEERHWEAAVVAQAANYALGAAAVPAQVDEADVEDLELASWDDVTFFVDVDNSSLTAMEILQHLQSLETLNVDLHPVFAYAGELEDAVLPRLRSLTLTTYGADFGPFILAAHLIRVGAGTLERLKVCHSYARVHEVVVREVAKCVNLRSLKINLLYMPVVKNMRSLRSLEMGVCWDKNPAITLHEVNCVRRFLAREHKVLHHLKRLGLEFDEDVAVPSLKELLVDVIGACPNVTELDLYVPQDFYTGLLQELLAFVPHVVRLRIGTCRASDLPDLSILPELRKFSAWIPSGEDGKEFYLRAIEDMKQKWPAVEMEMKIT